MKKLAGNVEEFESLKNNYSGKRCFIIATGPSLAYKDLSFLRGEVIISLNLASLTLDLFNIKPTFNIVADKYQYIKYKQIFEELMYNNQIKKVIVASACETFPIELIDKNTFFFPKKLPQDSPRFSEDPIKEGFSRGKTVVYDAIQLAYYLGFSEVYIIGMDLGQKYEWGKNGHCYEICKNKKYKNIEFAKTEENIIQRGLPGNPEYKEFIERCMCKAKAYFEKSNKNLINDISSNLNVLEKEDILNKFGSKKKVVAFVPAKGTSSRLEGKNVKKLGNKPLFLHVLDTLLKCDTIDEVYLDSESEEIFNLAKGRGHKELRRNPKLATNDIDGNELLLNESSKIDADIYVQVLPTAPFLSKETIDEIVFNLIISKDHDSSMGVIKDYCYLWDSSGSPKNYDPLNIPNSVDLNPTIIETMGLYVITKESLLKRKCRIGNNPILHEIPLRESIDIDTLEDFNFAEIIFAGKDVLENEKR